MVGMISIAWGWIGTNSPAIQAVCIVFSAIAAFAVIFHNGRISRQSSTISMVNSTFFDDGGRKNYNEFKKLINDIEDSGQNIASLAANENENLAATETILRQLNTYELIALGIKKKVFDEAFYKLWFFSQLTRDYDKLLPYIEAVRERYKNQAYFCEFASLARRWNKNKHPVKHPPMWKIIWWLLKGEKSKAMAALSSR